MAILLSSWVTTEAGDTPVMVSYGEEMVQNPRYRTWNGLDWAGERSANSVGGTTRWAVLRAHPSKAEAILGVLDMSGHLNAQVWDGDSWGTVVELTTDIGPSNSAYRGFDIAYEQSSGDAIIVYQNKVNDPLYRIWNGTSWSAPATLDLPTSNIPVWIALASKPGSDEIVVMALDLGSDVTAAVWNGSSWGNTITLESTATVFDMEPMAIAYEYASGRAMVIWGDFAAHTSQYRLWNGTSWGAEGQVPSTWDNPVWIRLASDPSGNTIAMGELDWALDINVNIWDGSSWGTNSEIETKVETIVSRCFDVAFEQSGDQAVVAWAASNDHTLLYSTWSSGTGWSSPVSGPDMGNDIQIVQLRADPNSAEIMLGTITDDWDVQLTLWTGSSWGTPLEVDTSAPFIQYEPYMLCYRPGAVTWSWIYPTSGSIGGIVSSPVIRNGRVYVGSDDAMLYCLDASDGSLIWTYPAGDAIRSSPAAAEESGSCVLYFGANNGYVYAVRDAGSSYEEKWTKNLGALIGSSPALWDTLLYIGSNDDSIHCLRMSDGSQKWATYLYADISSSPAVFNDVVYIGSRSDTLYALNHLDGTVLRTYRTCGDIVAPAFLTWETGRICIGSYVSATPGSDTMYVVNSSNFSTYWKFADSGNLARIYTSAWCFPFTTKVNFGTDNDCMYAIDMSDLSLIYKYNTGDDIRSSPLSWNGLTYFGSNNDAFYALDDLTHEPTPDWPFVTNGNVESSPAISVSGSIAVVGSSDGHVYAFGLE